MALEYIIYSHTWAASGDLSSYIGYAVQLNGDLEVALANATSETLGILQNGPDAQGEEAEVGMIGISIAVAGAAITLFDHVAPDSAGKLQTTTTNLDDFVGIAMTAALADGDEFEVFLRPFGQMSTS